MTMVRRRLMFAALCALATSRMLAHEIGTSRVSAAFYDSRTYDIELVTDAAALGEKLRSVEGQPALVNPSAADLQLLLRASDERFRSRVSVSFDDAVVRPAITYTVVPALDRFSAPAATIHLKGAIPPGVKNFSWSFGWTFASYALTVRGAESTTIVTQWLEGGQQSKTFTLGSPVAAARRSEIAARYLRLGFTHIVPLGLDHMLFVLGIYLLTRRVRSVLVQVSAFTVAHSITLALSMYGVIAVSPRIVEPMIAISIAYIAIENILLSDLKAWRVGLVFLFGLLHGMGFAGALKELGLPASEFVTALLTFNLGVEAGQLTVIGVAFLLVGWHWADRSWYRVRVVIPASAVIACTAVYWTVERLLS